MTALLLSIHSTSHGEVSAIKSAAGVVVVWDKPDCRFTVEIPCKAVELLEHSAHFFIKVDGVPFQIQTAKGGNILANPADVAPAELLKAHRDWEEKSLEKAVEAEIVPESEDVTLTDGTEALIWSYRMPKGMDAEVARQLYLTCAIRDEVVVLNAVVFNGKKVESIRQKLVAAANSLRVYDAPIDLQNLRESLKAPVPAGAREEHPRTPQAKPEPALTPVVGSPERTAIMNLFRTDFYEGERAARENPKRILFVVHHLKVKDGWACAFVTPTINGKEIAEPRWGVFKKGKDFWVDVDYFEKLRPFSHEAETLDALDMKKEIVARLLPKLPGCPREIFP
ncbi:MAG: hypothetical protein ACRDBP_11825 [Luteolibacter sp.]